MNEDLTLAIDTSTSVGVGLARGEEILGRAVVEDRMAHVEQLIPLVHRLCTEAEIAVTDCRRVVVGLGPGPYTGLRVGIVAARVLASVSGAALRGVCSLDVIAAAYASHGSDVSRPEAEFVVATDARRKEVYWARYTPTGVRIDGPSVSLPDQLPVLPVVGPGADLYPDALRGTEGPRSLDPGLLAARGWTLPDEGASPLYLRRPDAAEPSRRKSVLARRRSR